MMKIFTLILALVWLYRPAIAQKYKSQKSTITFFSSAPVEDIDSSNDDASSAFDIETGEVVFSVPINQFEFKKNLMKEHFNEKYMETEKYPKATFAGVISGYDSSASGQQHATAKGNMTIHGVTNNISIDGTLVILGDKVTMESEFIVKLVDYEIEIPQLLWKNIAEEIEVTISFEYKKI
ncbi:MAG: YceI family protein [Cyclobacteriaceae bacterium]